MGEWSMGLGSHANIYKCMSVCSPGMYVPCIRMQRQHCFGNMVLRTKCIPSHRCPLLSPNVTKSMGLSMKCKQVTFCSRICRTWSADFVKKFKNIRQASLKQCLCSHCWFPPSIYSHGKALGQFMKLSYSETNHWAVGIPHTQSSYGFPGLQIE